MFEITVETNRITHMGKYLKKVPVQQLKFFSQGVISIYAAFSVLFCSSRTACYNGDILVNGPFYL